MFDLQLVYTGRVTCAECERVCGISKPVMIYNSNNYCKTCAGKLMFNMLHGIGIDTKITLCNSYDVEVN